MFFRNKAPLLHVGTRRQRLSKIDWSEADALREQLTTGQQQFARKIISQLAEKWTLWTLAVLDASDKPLRFSRVMEQLKASARNRLRRP